MESLPSRGDGGSASLSCRLHLPSTERALELTCPKFQPPVWLPMTLLSPSCDAPWTVHAYCLGPLCLTESSSKFCFLPNPVWFGLGLSSILPWLLTFWALAKLKESGLNLAPSCKSQCCLVNSWRACLPPSTSVTRCGSKCTVSVRPLHYILIGRDTEYLFIPSDISSVYFMFIFFAQFHIRLWSYILLIYRFKIGSGY